MNLGITYIEQIRVNERKSYDINRMAVNLRMLMAISLSKINFKIKSYNVMQSKTTKPQNH